MREYSKVGPKFWIGATGKRLRAAGMEAQIVAMYLLTSPHANMLGLYYCPEMFIAHETGMGLEGASKGLQSAIEAGFCEYDPASEVVWVIEMASYQIADSLKPADLRVKGVHNEYMAVPSNPYLARFYEKYKEAFCMTESRELLNSPKAPSKPLASQEQEQEQKKEQEQEQEQDKEKQGAGAPGVSDPDFVGDVIPAKPEQDDDTPPADPPADPEVKNLGVRELVAEGVDKQHAKDWLTVRRAKRAPLTPTAWDDVKAEAVKAGLTPAEAVHISATNSWQGFKKSWLDKAKTNLPAGAAPGSAHGGFEQRNYGTGGRL